MAGILAVSMLALPARALATSSLDRSSTSKFVAAWSRVVQAESAMHGQEAAAANALIGHVESTCPDALPKNLADGTAAEQRTGLAFSLEATLEMLRAVIGPTQPATRRALGVIAPLRWTSATLNREVATFVREERAASPPPPDLCEQAEAAAKSGFTVVPRATARFVAPRPGDSGSVVTLRDLVDRMRPLAGPQALAAIKRVDRLQARVGRAFSHLATTSISRLIRALSS